MEKQTFAIPSGCTKVTVEQIENTIVTTFESEKYIPKVGDCFKTIRKIPTIAYCNEMAGDSPKCTSTYIEHGEVSTEIGICNCIIFIHSNDFVKLSKDEFQAEFNRLGYEYNFDTHEAVKIKWKPKNNEKYWIVTSKNTVEHLHWFDDTTDNTYFQIGNYYKTPEEAEKRRQHYLSFKD